MMLRISSALAALLLCLPIALHADAQLPANSPDLSLRPELPAVPSAPAAVAATRGAVADLLPPEEITAETDLRPYLHPDVAPEVQRAAMQAKWRLNLRIRNYVDPARDYVAAE